jgi:putative GTP pyrophosphokinase
VAQISPFSLIGEYVLQRPSYEAFTGALAQLLRNLLSASDIEILAIESRTKTSESFSDKVRSDDKVGKYDNLQDITDLTGIRIIAYLREDCDRICDIIKNNFTVDKKNSIDKGADREDQFGYSSTHFVVSFDRRRAILPEFVPFKDLKGEIQVRTVLQHAWAALDWRFRYKTAKEAPVEVRRKLFRISATLEGADENFSEVYQAVSELREQYADNVKAGKLNVRINADSLGSFLRFNPVVTELYQSFIDAGFSRSEDDSEDDPDSLSRLLNNLSVLKINTLESLEDAITRPGLAFNEF